LLRSTKSLVRRLALVALSLALLPGAAISVAPPASADPYQVEGLSEDELLKNIDLHRKPDSSTHLFLWWIDHYGKKVQQLNYEAVDVLQGGVAAAVKKGSYGSVLIGIEGQPIGKEEYASIGHYSEGLIPASTQLNWGFIDRSGGYVINPQFASVEEFREGLAPACKDKLFGYIDRLGNFVIPPKFQKALSFYENLAAAKYKGKWGYIDKDANFDIPPAYDEAGKFSDERACVKVGTKWGVIDPTGKVIVEPKYVDAGFFREGICPVKDGEHWGFIDRQGNMVIEAKLDRAFSFHEGNAAVRMGNKFGYIDHDCKFEIPAAYDLALPFAEGVAVVGQINWDHPSARMFLLNRHLETMTWRKDDDDKAQTGFYVPANQEDAVKELLKTLPPKAIEDMKVIGLDEMASYQFGLGLQMRNNWGMWKASRLGQWYSKKGIKQPEDMSSAILTALWHNLHTSK